MILILFPFAAGSAFSDPIIAMFGQKSLSLQKLFVNIKVHSWETKLAKVTFTTDKPEWITLLEISIVVNEKALPRVKKINKELD